MRKRKRYKEWCEKQKKKHEEEEKKQNKYIELYRIGITDILASKVLNINA